MRASGRPALAALGRLLVRTTGADGSSRSRSAGVGHGGGRRSSGEPPPLGPPRSRRARKAASSVRLIHQGAGGALARGGLRLPIRQCGGMEPPVVRVWCVRHGRWARPRPPGSTRVRAPGGTETPCRQTALSDPEAPILASQHARVPGTRRFLHSGWEKLENRSGEFFKEGNGGRSQGTPLAPGTPPGTSGRPAPPPPCPTEAHCPSHTPDGPSDPPFAELFPLWEGRGGRALASVSSGGLAQLSQGPDGAPPSACGAPLSPYGSHLRDGGSLHAFLQSFSKEGGGEAARGTPGLQGGAPGRQDRLLPHSSPR